MCRGSEVVVVGGGNSAGQAAVYLAGQVRKVYLVIRGDDLYEHMSSYLADRIEETPNIEVLLNTEVTAMHGDGHLSAVELVNKKTGEVRTIQTPALFSFIGAVPRTDWLPGGDREGREGVRPDGDGPGAGPPPGQRPESVPAGDQPARRVRRGRRAVRLGQAGRLGRRRGVDGRPVRARVPQGERRSGRRRGGRPAAGARAAVADRRCGRRSPLRTGPAAAWGDRLAPRPAITAMAGRRVIFPRFIR